LALKHKAQEGEASVIAGLATSKPGEDAMLCSDVFIFLQYVTTYPTTR